MNRKQTAPGGRASQGRAAGRTGRLSREFPHKGYHGKSRDASRSKRLMVALTPQGARKTGMLAERDGILRYVRKVDSVRHLLRLPEPSWAFDEAKLLEAQRAGAERVEVHDETGKVWWTSLTYVLDRGQRFDRGHGRQVRLALSHWSFLPKDSMSRGQLCLFAEARG